MLNILKRLVNDEEGQGLVEYALIIALVSVAITAALITLRGDIAAAFLRIKTHLNP